MLIINAIITLMSQVVVGITNKCLRKSPTRKSWKENLPFLSSEIRSDQTRSSPFLFTFVFVPCSHTRLYQQLLIFPLLPLHTQSKIISLLPFSLAEIISIVIMTPTSFPSCYHVSISRTNRQSFPKAGCWGAGGVLESIDNSPHARLKLLLESTGPCNA